MNSETYKNELIHQLNYYSKYYCRQLIECESLFENGNGHISVFYLFSLLENVIKSTLNDFESTNYKLIQKLQENYIINQTESEFLNNSQNGIRKIRNIFAHANLSKFDLKFSNEVASYPFTENETCLLLYSKLSNIICGIILKIITPLLILDNELDLTHSIEKLDYQIIEHTSEELMKYKGMDTENIKGWNELNESSKYRLAENSSDVHILSGILGNLK